MPQQHAFERLAGGVRNDFGAFIQAVTRQRRLAQAVGQDQQALGRAYQRVLKIGMQRHRLVGRQRPRRGGPDDDLDRFVDGRNVEAAREVGAVGTAKPTSIAERSCPRIRLGLGQRRAAVDAPVHRLGALIKVARCRICPSTRRVSASNWKSIVR